MIRVTNLREGAGDISTSSISKHLSTSRVLRNEVSDVVHLSLVDHPGGLVRTLDDVVLLNLLSGVLLRHDDSEFRA